MGVSLEHEHVLWDAGARVVAGIDEVGRGALAGPVCVGVVALERRDDWPEGLADSKALTASRRVAMAEALAAYGVARAVGSATAAEVDGFGIVSALRLAGTRALAQIAGGGVRVDAVLLDGKHDWLTPPARDLFSGQAAVEGTRPMPELPVEDVPAVTTIVKGDGKCASIAAGSVLAKVQRDDEMTLAAERHPEYGWDENKGYGAAGHLDALRAHGPTPLHRTSWNLPIHEGESA